MGLVQETLSKCESGVYGEPSRIPGVSLELPVGKGLWAQQ